MPTQISARYSLDERSALLQKSPALAPLGLKAMRPLAIAAEEVRFEQNTVIVREGDTGERAFLIIAGHAEVTVIGPAGIVVLATLSPGELFGEAALFDASGIRNATVTATTPIHLLAITGRAFRKLVDADPDARAHFDAMIQLMATMRFLKLAASPFAALPPERFRQLTKCLKPLSVAKGETIIKQGAPGDSCFLIKSGNVAVMLEADNKERQIATLSQGALFGESALLTTAPRSTTVRATEESELLALNHKDFIEIVGRDPAVVVHMRGLLEMRTRPKQIPNVVAVTNLNRAGEPLTILKDPARKTYYRLSAEGAFIWQRLDGEHCLKDLTIAYMREFKAFAPQAIVETVSGLSFAGFVQGPHFRSESAPASEQSSSWQKFAQTAKSVLEFQIAFRNVDGFLTRIYKGGFSLLYTRAVQILLAVLSGAGIFLFALDASHTAEALKLASPWLLLFLIPAQIFGILVHEGGHALTTKACGREVQGLGIGWYWYGIIAFVDTSDMWLASRWERVKVSLAGPYANLILGSIASIIAHGLADPSVKAVLWQFTITSYLAVIVNLNPLLEYDGYYILADILDRPNLRQQALFWLGHSFLPALKDWRVLKTHLFDILFGFGSILYVLVMGIITVILYRVFLQNWLSGIIPASLASGIAWGLAGLLVVFSITQIVSDMRSR